MTDAVPTLDVLYPVGQAPLPPQDDEAALLDLLEHPAPRHVRANMIASLDGAGTGPDRVTGSINGPADLRVFEALRTLADVVLVGAGTVRQEGYGALTLPPPLARARHARRGTDAPPELAVVTRSGVVPDALLGSARPPFVVTTAACAQLEPLRERIGADRVLVTTDGTAVDLRAALDALADRGLGRVLCEGGPSLLAQLAAGDLLDELCLTWSPTLVGGDAPRILDGAPWLPVDRTARLGHLLHGAGTLLSLWRLPGAGASSQVGQAAQ